MAIPRLRAAFALIAVVLTGAWLVSLPAATFDAGFWAARQTLIYYTGVLAMGFMSLGVVLAARPVQIEGLLGGLDKFYRLHKWLGVGGVVLAIVHWLLEIAPRWLVGWGWLARPARPGGGGPAGAGGAGLDLLRQLHGAAASIGEWVLYLLIALVLLALWKRFPYRHFFRTHRLMAPAYLALVFHAVVLMPPGYWTAPVGPLMAVLMAAGTVAAGMSLFRRIGQSRRATGTVTSLHRYLGNAVLDVGVRLETAWPGHDAGQFAFVTFDAREGAHPFTISSAWQGDGRLLFSIKGLGDYTRQLADQLRIGQAATIEGPYGRFDFRGIQSRQIWIGGGVGITPFIARLKALAEAGRENADAIDLVYCTRAADAGFIDNIRQLAERAKVRFHLLVEQQDGLLTLDRLAEMVPEWSGADLWFCGPAAFGESLRSAMAARGFSLAHFHQELFEMR